MDTIAAMRMAHCQGQIQPEGSGAIWTPARQPASSLEGQTSSNGIVIPE
jgi:hypothetical protein